MEKKAVTVDPESERLILSAAMDNEQTLAEILAQITTEDFSDSKHQLIFDIIKDLYAQNVKPSFLEIIKKGAKAGLLTAQDREYVKDLVGSHVTVQTLPFWIKQLKDKTIMRRIRQLMLKTSEAMKSDKNTEDLLAELEQGVMSLRALEVDQTTTGKDLAEAGRKAAAEAEENKGKLLGLPTGLGRLNRLTGGFKGGDLIILAGATGHGKTTFAQNFLATSCIGAHNPALYVNSEMSEKQVIMRFGSMLGGVENEKVKFGEMNPKEKADYAIAMAMVEEAPLLHYHSPDLNLSRTIAQIRKAKLQKNIQMCVVDYVGRMDTTSSNGEAEWQILYNIVKTLKTLAQELDIAMVVLAQLNDDLTNSLQGSKRMRNECDVFLKILPASHEQMVEMAEELCTSVGSPVCPNYLIQVEKNRDGQAGVAVPVLFDKPRLTIKDVVNR